MELTKEEVATLITALRLIDRNLDYLTDDERALLERAYAESEK